MSTAAGSDRPTGTPKTGGAATPEPKGPGVRRSDSRLRDVRPPGREPARDKPSTADTVSGSPGSGWSPTPTNRPREWSADEPGRPSDAAGSDAAGSDAAGSDVAGSDAAGPTDDAGRDDAAPANDVPPANDAARPNDAARSNDARRPGAAGSLDDAAPTTVLPGASGSGGVRRPAAPRPSRVIGRSTPARAPVAEPARQPGKGRRAKLALQRIDPWSVFLYSLVASLFLGLALVVAVAALYAVLGRLGVLETVNELFLELAGGDAAPIFTAGRFVGGAVVIAAVNVVLLTLLATLGSLLYNLCASFTGGIEVTLGDRDA